MILQQINQKLFELIQKEEQNQLRTVNFVASENYISPYVKQALQSSLSNKYAEGLPCERTYPGVEILNQIEELCIQEVKKAFRIPENWCVNVQPLSGAPANLELLTAFYPLGSTVLMLSHHQGGHMSHGDEGSLIKRIYKVYEYHLNNQGLLDYDSIESDIIKYKPQVLIAGYCLYPRDIDYKKLSEICHKHNCNLHVDMAHISGFIASGLMNSPFEYADSVTSTTHKTLRGPRGGIICAKVQEGQQVKDIEKKIYSGVFPNIQAGPHMASIAGLAQACYEAQQEEFKQYMIRNNRLANMSAQYLMKNGIHVQTNGTDCHMLIVQAQKDTVEKLGQAGIYVNDCELVDGSYGIRMGFSCMSTFKVKDERIIDIIDIIVKVIKNGEEGSKYRSQVEQWCLENFEYQK